MSLLMRILNGRTNFDRLRFAGIIAVLCAVFVVARETLHAESDLQNDATVSGQPNENPSNSHGKKGDSQTPSDDSKKSASNESNLPNESKEKIRTILVLDENDRPIRGASVRFQFHRHERSFDDSLVSDPQTTKEDGQASATIPEGHNWVTIIVKAEGFEKTIQTGSAKEATAIRLARGQTLTLRPVDREGRLQKSAVVWPAPSLFVASDFTLQADGTLRSTQLNSMLRFLRVVAPSEEGAMLFSELIDLASAPRDKNDVIEVTLQPGVRLEGALDDSVPRPVKAGFVQLFINELQEDEIRWGSWTWNDVASIEPNGRFVFESVPANTHAQLHSVADGYLSQQVTDQTLNQYFTRHKLKPIRTFMGLGPLMVAMDAPVVSIQIPCEPSASCRIHLLDPSGRPIQNAKLWLGAANDGEFLGGQGFCAQIPKSSAWTVDDVVRTRAGLPKHVRNDPHAGRLILRSDGLVATSDEQGWIHVQNLRGKTAETGNNKNQNLQRRREADTGKLNVQLLDAKGFLMPSAPSAVSPFGQPLRRTSLKLVSGQTAELTIHLERDLQSVEREVLVVDSQGKMIEGMEVTLNEMRVGPRDWQLWNVQRFGSIVKGTTDSNGRVILKHPSVVDDVRVESLRLETRGNVDINGVSRPVGGDFVDFPVRGCDGLIVLQESDRNQLAPVHREFHEFYPDNRTQDLLNTFVKAPNLAVFRRLLEASVIKTPEPVRLLKDDRRGRKGTGVFVREAPGPQAKVVVVEANVRPFDGKRDNENDLNNLPEAVFLFDQEGRLLTWMGGKNEVGPTKGGLPDSIQVLSLGPSEDWFVWVTQYENVGEFSNIHEFFRVGNPPIKSLRVYAKSPSWTVGSESKIRFGQLYFATDLRKAARSLDGIIGLNFLVWDGDRDRFLGLPMMFEGTTETCHVDQDASTEFAPLTPTADQIVIVGGMSAANRYRWQFVVPEKMTAQVRLIRRQESKDTIVVQENVDPGQHQVELFESGKDDKAEIEMSLNYDLGKQPKSIRLKFGENQGLKLPLMRVINPGGSARLLVRPLATPDESLVVEIDHSSPGKK